MEVIKNHCSQRAATAYYDHMNTVMLFALVSATIIGFLNGLSKMDKVRKNPSLGVKPSRNMFYFMFNDRY